MKKLLALIFLIIVAIVGYIAAQPYWVASEIRDAIETKDRVKLAKHIDFVQVRANVTPRIKADIKQTIQSGIQDTVADSLPMPKSWADKLTEWSKPYMGKLSDEYLADLVTTSVNSLLTPQGMMNVIEGIETLPTNNNGSSWQSRIIKNSIGIEATKHDDNVTLGYKDKNTFIVSKTFTTPARVLDLVMTRNGLDWRVTDMQMYQPGLEAELKAK